MKLYGMKLYFLLRRRGSVSPSPLLAEVFLTLKRRGFEVDAGIPEELVVSPAAVTVEHDLYVLKSHSELSLSLAGCLHDQGARVLNPYPCSALVHDKVMASRRLRAAGIPSPRSWCTDDLTLLRPLAEERRLIIKPHRSSRGAGVHVVHSPRELAAIAPPTMAVMVQEYVEGTGQDLKVYVVGDHVFAVRKPFSPTSYSEPGSPCPVSAEVGRIALCCGRVFGLGLFGVDMIESPHGPVVIDVNWFPGYKGAPNVAPLIADYITDYARGRLQLALPPALEAPAEERRQARAAS
jgi:glutathione synthase/RimK-type ligase-like ATP-grasp enzyme